MTDKIKNGFDVAREIANSFVDGQPRKQALLTVDNYEKVFNEQQRVSDGYLWDVSEHYKSVRKFMEGAKQECPDKPTIPDEKTRLLRAKLILEEALETVDALCVRVFVGEYELIHDGLSDLYGGGDMCMEAELKISDESMMDSLEKIIDGCCDLKVVTTGTLIACGIPDEYVQKLVDDNNLDKIERGTIRDDGKLIKPDDHQPPDIGKFLGELGYVDSH